MGRTVHCEVLYTMSCSKYVKYLQFIIYSIYTVKYLHYLVYAVDKVVEVVGHSTTRWRVRPVHVYGPYTPPYYGGVRVEVGEGHAMHA